MKQIGIWLDKQEALILVLENGEERFFTIPSELDFYNPKGGSRSKTRWGPQDVVQDSKYMEAEKHQLKRYFAKIVKTLEDIDELVIFGPAEAREKFTKELEQNHLNVASKIKVNQKTDSMTQNQFKALVKRSFNVDAHEG
ncbi:MULTISPECIES: hypothetical protein [Flavobacteriaceae]|uniref:hypothetical protein n=1 Tax=Flavobacteriaceae TaxID=49546 RepID=UPI0014911C74|nr:MULTISPECIES: hypothetical protein [Allomuricauda]MDC6365944.1 hypothetical protein [Muricauda sp. AC10]